VSVNATQQAYTDSERRRAMPPEFRLHSRVLNAAPSKEENSQALSAWFRNSVEVPVTGISARLDSGEDRSFKLHGSATTTLPAPVSYSEADFRRLAAQGGVLALAELIRCGNLPPGQLSFAAEVLGEAGSPETSLQYLGPYLLAPEVVVREGAILGLSRHSEHPRVRQLLTAALAIEPSPTLRGEISESLAG